MIRSYYLNPRCCFSLDQFEIVKETGTTIRGRFASNVTFDVEVKEVDVGEFEREEWSGLMEMEVPLARVIEIEINGDGLVGSEIEIFYRDSDLDRSGDGSVDGPGDFEEGSLDLFFMNESSLKWERVNESLNWVDEVILNETDFESYGITFSGRVTATLKHLSTYVLVGRLIEHDDIVDVVADPGGGRTVYVGEEVILNASGSVGNGRISNFTWTVMDLVLYGPVITLQFDLAGVYNVSLLVTDQLGLSNLGMASIEVIEREVLPVDLTLAVGPIVDEDGNGLQGASVRIIWNSTEFSNSTGEDGRTSIILPAGLLNRSVKLIISMEGYHPVEMDVWIDPEGEIEGIPALKIIEDEPEDDEFPYWIFVVLIILILVAVVILVIRKKSGFEEEE